MPYKEVDRVHGAVIFKRTPEEKMISDIKLENEHIRSQLKDLNDAVMKLVDRIDILEKIKMGGGNK